MNTQPRISRAQVVGLVIGLIVCFVTPTPVGLAEAPAGVLPPMGPAGRSRPIALRPVRPASEPVEQVQAQRLTRLFDAIRAVESNGDDWAIGDGGASRGPYQIGRAYWRDATRFAGADWTYDTGAYSRPHSEQVLLWYWRAHCPRDLEDYLAAGRIATAEVLARIHNGGPAGLHKRSTARYWRRVRALLD